MIDVREKKCSRCPNSYPATNQHFYNLKSAHDGLQHYCKKCSNEYSVERAKHRKLHPKPKPDGLTMRDVAKRCGVSEDTVRADIKQAKLPAQKLESGVWSINPQDADVYVQWKQQSSIDRVAIIAHGILCNHQVEQKIVLGDSNTCGSCGTTKNNIFGDVDATTGQQYGYLCMKCNRLVTAFHGDAGRMRSVLAYLEETRKSIKPQS